ncbi:MAG TPA: hypothetical protein ENG10_02935 [Candidatus Bathyarchaeota archaeon]|nr:hypothetical protein [Candidatus Bathyarchaeota archaeon]HEX69231.1 hypothetical protein [Candidatus Bathyarchaeota archaeon]
MTEFVDLIPEELIDPKKKEEFLMWLINLPVDIWTKKYILIEWCNLVGVALTEDLVKEVIGRAELTWG